MVETRTKSWDFYHCFQLVLRISLATLALFNPHLLAKTNDLLEW
jgi:hypothetical protein